MAASNVSQVKHNRSVTLSSRESEVESVLIDIFGDNGNLDDVDKASLSIKFRNLRRILSKPPPERRTADGKTILTIGYVAGSIAILKTPGNEIKDFEKLSLILQHHSQGSMSPLKRAEILQRKGYGSVPTNLMAHKISGAVPYAIEEINRDPNILPNHVLEFVFNDTYGRFLDSVRAVMYQWDAGVVAVIGPEDTCAVEATIAAAQNLPMISFKCLDYAVSNKRRFPTFARTIPTHQEISGAVISMLKHYSWYKFTIVYGDMPKEEQLYEAIKRLSREHGLTIQNVSTFNEPFSHIKKGNREKIYRIVEETYKETRIYVMFGNYHATYHFLFYMDSLHLFDTGEYIVIYLDPEYAFVDAEWAIMSKYYKPSYLLTERFFDESENYRRIFEFSQFLFVLIPTPIETKRADYVNFWNKVVENNKEQPFSFVSKEEVAPSMSPFASYLYDAVKLYGYALHHTIESGGDPRNGTAIIEFLLGKSYNSMQGFRMQIDRKGDAKGNYTLLARQTVTPDMIFKNPNITFALLPTANFEDRPPGENSLEDETINNVEGLERLPVIKFINKRSIFWKNGAPPKDEPECGFHSELCSENKDYSKFIIVGVTMAFALIIVIVLVGFYKNWRYEQELAGLIWKIDPKEINIQTPFSKNYIGGSRRTIQSQESDDGSVYASFIPRSTATYKGSTVAVKEIQYPKKTPELSRGTKIEMKKMRNLHHDNVNMFMGLVIQPSSILIVREYCGKGSLFDILLDYETGKQKLDPLFTASFIDDLLKGMIYIHDSDLRVHGNLKSTNCLLTSRWSLQVADYALHELRGGITCAEACRVSSLLWTAPELLRTGALEKPGKGSQKADIYAVGVILHEIIARQGPLGSLGDDRLLSEREIVNSVKCLPCGKPPYRPNLEQLECQNYIKNAIRSSWMELPEQRPELRALRDTIKPLFKGIIKRNLMDHLMTMMEKYQSHLEDLVNERTQELNEEKKRTEMLLHRMLPQSVASELISGMSVVPKSFNCVTIYFSDIVGFTSLSAESTPLQVVSFLNELYTLFDRVIKRYDVYKVETIGDAYMVVSGLPEPNGDQHAGQIATMALHLLQSVKTFQIPHRPDKQLLLRIGIHTGPCVAGVVGKTMPRYCLFGDTVNTASRMESCGVPLKIHCSESTKIALDKLGDYILEERGMIPMKGKGEMRTFWLLGQRNEILTEPESEIPSDIPLFPSNEAPERKKQNFVGPSVPSYSSLQRAVNQNLPKSRTPNRDSIFCKPVPNANKRVGKPQRIVSECGPRGLKHCTRTAAGAALPSCISGDENSYTDSCGSNPVGGTLLSPVESFRNRKRSMSFPDSNKILEVLSQNKMPSLRISNLKEQACESFDDSKVFIAPWANLNNEAIFADELSRLRSSSFAGSSIPETTEESDADAGIQFSAAMEPSEPRCSLDDKDESVWDCSISGPSLARTPYCSSSGGNDIASLSGSGVVEKKVFESPPLASKLHPGNFLESQKEFGDNVAQRKRSLSCSDAEKVMAMATHYNNNSTESHGDIRGGARAWIGGRTRNGNVVFRHCQPASYSLTDNHSTDAESPLLTPKPIRRRKSGFNISPGKLNWQGTRSSTGRLIANSYQPQPGTLRRIFSYLKKPMDNAETDEANSIALTDPTIV